MSRWPLGVCFFAMMVSYPAFAQTSQISETRIHSVATSSSCGRDSALESIREQVIASRLIEDTGKRIAVLTRAADLLWPFQVDKARAAFVEAFDLASDDHKQKNEPNAGAATNGDQRYKVIAAIAKRDPSWARKLSNQILKDEVDEAKTKPASDPTRDIETAQKLLSAAVSLLASDQTSALGFAINSLRYPATLYLPVFFYKYAELNRSGADRFYQEALSVYAGAAMDQFLYLSSYPFGKDREAGEMSAWTVYVVPSSFTPNANLQRLFVLALLRRCQQMIEYPREASIERRLSDSDQMWVALTRLGPQVDQLLPDLTPALSQARERIFAGLSQNAQQRVVEAVTDRPTKSFDELIEAAERLSNSARRDAAIAIAILGVSKAENLESVLGAAAKIDDPELRDKLLNWIYFEWARQAIKDNRLPEAKRLAAKVAEIDQRAYLYVKIVEESIKENRIDTSGRELLEEVLDSAAKAADTEVKARVLLNVAYLYTKLEPNRSIAVLSEAVKCINHIESPDFSNDYVQRKIESKEFRTYAKLQTPGFNPENGFREIAKYDFDGALNLAVNLANKPLRAMTTMMLAEWCLQNSPPPGKPAKVEPKVVKP